MMSSFSRMDKHVLLCGDNVLTRQLALSLTSQGKICFFMESDVTIANTLEADGFNVVQVNPENADELKQVNLHKAICIVSAYEDDSKNILVMMTAQSLNEDTKNDKLQLIARIEQPHNLDKAKRAGATQVISPLKMSAEWVAKVLG
jgi:Trk K+ transport system NAD-binding subunit